MATEDWKARLGIVYSTNSDFDYQTEEIIEEDTLESKKQKLIIALDRRNRGGKQVTLVKGFIGREEDLISLSKILKNKLGVGGSVKDGEIIIQGDFRDRLLSILTTLEYGAKRGN